MSVITLTSLSPSTQPVNNWPSGNSYNMLQSIYNDLVSLNAASASLAGANTFAAQITSGVGVLEKHTPVDIASTAAGTLAVVTSGVLAGAITSTSASGVTLTLDSAANMIAAFLAAGRPVPTATSMWKFIVDNSAGANTITVAVDSGATIAVTTPALTGGAALTVSTANVLGVFGLYFTSATVAKILRLY